MSVDSTNNAACTGIFIMDGAGNPVIVSYYYRMGARNKYGLYDFLVPLMED
jgi:hypothetical protein